MPEPKYSDLNELLNAQGSAQSFYTSLPEYIRDMISDRGDKIHTEKDLVSYADNLLSGDK